MEIDNTTNNSKARVADLTRFANGEAYQAYPLIPEYITLMKNPVIERVARARGRFIAPIRELADAALLAETDPDVSDTKRLKKVARGFIETKKRINAEYTALKEPVEAVLAVAKRRDIEPEMETEKAATDAEFDAALFRSGAENTKKFIELTVTYDRALHNAWRRGDGELFGVEPEIERRINEALSTLPDRLVTDANREVLSTAPSLFTHLNTWRRQAMQSAREIVELYGRGE